MTDISMICAEAIFRVLYVTPGFKPFSYLEFMFLGINIFWALLRAHFNPGLTAWAKMSVSRAQNIFVSTNINFIVLITKTVQSLRENLKPRPTILTSLLLGQYGKASV